MSFRSLAIGSAFLTFALFAILVLSLLFFFEWDIFRETLFSGRMLFSIRLSLLAATLAILCSAAVAVPAAFALSRYDFRLKRLVDTLLELPLVISPAALGAMLLIFFNNPLGEWVQANGPQFVFTFYGIVLAQFVTTAGLATRLIRAAMDEIPTRYEEVARSLGASPLKAFLTVTLPLSKRGIIAALILSWAKAVGEFGATITLAGSMAMRTETIPVAIYMRLSSADIDGAVAAILILVIMGMSILYVVRTLSKETPHA